MPWAALPGTIHQHHAELNMVMKLLIPMTTLVATVSNDFIRLLPDAHAPRGTNAKIVPAISPECYVCVALFY